MISNATYLGDFAAERSVLLAFLPPEAPEGAILRAIHLVVGEELRVSRQDYWLLALGTHQGGRFIRMAKEIALDGLVPEGVVRRYEIADPLLLSRGTALLARISPRGLPPPLIGASVVPEWGVQASRRSTRG